MDRWMYMYGSLENLLSSLYCFKETVTVRLWKMCETIKRAILYCKTITHKKLKKALKINK